VEQLLDGLSGEASDQTINHLFSNINGNVVIVSQYVAHALAKANYENFIKIATLHSRNLNNVSFDGWVFQMDFLFHLKKAQSGNQFIKLISETWKVLNCIDFFDESELDNKNIVDGSWIIPSKINHGCYDAAQFTSQSDKNILRIVQLTVGKSHKLKLEYVVKLLRLECFASINSLEVVIVVPKGNKNTFTIGDVFSDNSVPIRKLNWKKTDILIKEFERLGQF